MLAMLFGVQLALADDEPGAALSWAIVTDPDTGQLTSATVDFPDSPTVEYYSVCLKKGNSTVWSGTTTTPSYDATTKILETGSGTYTVTCDAHSAAGDSASYATDGREFIFHTFTIDTAGHGSNIVLHDVMDGTVAAQILPAAYLNDLDVAPKNPYIDSEGKALAAIALHPKGHYSAIWSLQAESLYMPNYGIDQSDHPVLVDKDLTVYTVWFDIVDKIEITVSNPLCGTETHTPGNSGSALDQTNRPVCIFPANCGYGLDTLGADGGAAWVQMDENGTIHGDQLYDGAFEVGHKYAFQLDVMMDYGYVMPYGEKHNDVDVTVNGTPITGWSLLFYGDSYGTVFVSMVSSVEAIHNWNSSYTVDEPATCTQEGSESIHCAGCDLIKEGTSRVVKKAAHDYKQVSIKKATISADGLISLKCQRCGAETSEAIHRPKTMSLKTTSYTYNGKSKKPSVIVKDAKGKAIPAANYKIAYSNNVNAGKAKATITFKGGRYEGEKSLAFTISKALQTISANNAAKQLKAKSGKLAKTRNFSLKSIAKVKAKTAVSYAKANKAGGKRISIDTKTGKVVIKKGLKRGTYKVKVKLTADAGKNYKAAKAKTITLKVVVK